MDPYATVLMILAALDEHDTGAFDDSFADLIKWLNNAGYVPANVDVLLRAMDLYSDLAPYVGNLVELVKDHDTAFVAG